MQRYAFPLKTPNYLPKNFFLNKSLINRDLLGNALRKGSRSLSICIPTRVTVLPAPFFVLLMFLLFSMSVFFKLSIQLSFHSVHLVLNPADLLIRQPLRLDIQLQPVLAHFLAMPGDAREIEVSPVWVAKEVLAIG